MSLLSFRAAGQDAQLQSPLLDACERVELVSQPMRTRRDRLSDMLITRQPDMALRLASDNYASRLVDWLRQEHFDVLQFEGIEMGPYLDVIECVHPVPLIIFDDHNCEYLLQKRAFLTDLRIPTRWPQAAYSLVQWQRLRRYERHVCRYADHVLAVSEADAAAIEQLLPDLDVTVIPNGIDTQAYCPRQGRQQVSEVRPMLVFTGTMDFRPNVDAVLWFAQRVLPRIRAEFPQVRFSVVGQRPHRRLEPLRDNSAVTLTGWVEEVQPYIAQATVYVAPLRVGGGTRLKLLEAMAMGRPVVATRLGAEGYPVTDGQQLMLADTPDEFAGAVISLLQSPERRVALGESARSFVERRYDWRVIVPRVEGVYSGLL